MKNKVYILLLSLFTLVSCSASAKVEKVSSDSKGSRTITSGDAITSIQNKTPWDIDVVSSSHYAVSLKGPQNILNNINVVLRNGSLIISGKDGSHYSSSDASVKIRVSTDSLRQLISYSSGDIRVDAFNSTAVNMQLMGSGDVTVGSVRATSLTVQLQGAGDAHIGTLHTVSSKVILQGSGDIDIKSAETTSLDCTLQGSGDASISGIQATTVRAICHGSGDLTLAGVATAATYVMQGAGEINARHLRSKRSTRSNLGSGDIIE